MTTTSPPAAATAANRPGRSPGDATFARRQGWGGLGGVLEHVVVAVLSFVPLLAARPGVVTSDTKAYLYLDPWRFLRQVASMWDPTVALGTVTHQYVGYLLPMGPYYAATAALHVPTWVAQRLWLGGILFAAGAGVLSLCRVLAVEAPGRVVAALAYALSPYLLQYAGRISVLLLPWAGLPWLVALMVLAVRRGGWRYPALFALVVALVSGINASSALYAIVGPVLWVLCAATISKEATWGQGIAALARTGALAILVSAWWIAGLVVEAGFGVDVLRYTETVKATSSTSTPAEVLRGLGYWYFYGGSQLGPWTTSVVPYTTWLWLVALSFLLPALSFVAAVVVRWRQRVYFVALVVVGLVLSVGAYPYTHPTPVGRALKAFMTGTTAGLAMRSTDRATPLVLLGLAMLLGAGVSAVATRRSWVGWTTAVVVASLVVANNPALFNGDAEAAATRIDPASLPSYELAAARHLNAVHPGTRVLAIPGNDFAAYTWGTPNDTPQPAVLARPFVTRQQQVMGSMATADTLYALDAPIQTDTASWSALGPMARLLSAGDVLVEYDQSSAAYGSVPAALLARTLAPTPPGLSHPLAFGSPGQGVAAPPVGPQLLAAPPGLPAPSPLVTYTVRDPRPLVRAESDRGALVVAGDAPGLTSLAAQGLLGSSSAIYYAGTLDTRPSQLARLVAGGATLVVTDTNRKQGYRWNTLTGNTGYVETAGDHVARRTPGDSPLDLFPGAPTDARTLARYTGAADVTASSYGNTVSYIPEDRPYRAVDGNLSTAWVTGSFLKNADGQWWQIRFHHAVTADHVTLVQPQNGTRRRTITRVTLTFTGGSPRTVGLGPASRRSSGQVVTFPSRRFTRLRITIDATRGHPSSPVGFAEVGIPGQHVAELYQMPGDLLQKAGRASLRDRLILAMTRWRVSPYTQRSDPQLTLERTFTLPTARHFRLSGTATLTRSLSSDQVARLLGVPGSDGSGVVATSSGRLTGDLAAGAGAAADGNPATAWQSPFGAKNTKGAWLQYVLPSPVTFDHLTLQVVADRHHSVPTSVTVSAATATGQDVASWTRPLPPVVRSAVPGSTVRLPVHFPALTGQRIRVTFPTVAMKRGPRRGTRRGGVLPLGVAEVGIPGVQVGATPASLPGACRSNLITVDGHPVPVRVVGSTAAALAHRQVSLEPCGNDAGGLALSAGRHVVSTATSWGNTAPGCAATGGCSGWRVDRLTLDSAPGGAAAAGRLAPGATATGAGQLRAPSPGPVPRLTTTASSSTSRSLHVGGATAPFELVLGQSLNAGWRAVAHPGPGAPPGAHDVTLGRPELVDAFANGWAVTSHDLGTLGAAGTGGRFSVTLTWVPQRTVDAGLAVSAASLVLCLLLVLLPDRWRGWRPRRRRRAQVAGGRPLPPSPERAARATGPTAPVLAWPVGNPSPRRAPWWALVAVAAVTGALAGAISQPLAAPVVAAAVGAGLWARHLRVVGALAAVGLMVTAGAMIVVTQALHPLPASGNWPASFGQAAAVAALAVAFLGADAVVDYRWRADRRAEP